MAKSAQQQNTTSRIAIVFIVGALVVAGFATFGIVTLLSGIRDNARGNDAPVETVTVVAASRTLYQGVAITADDLFVVNIPPAFLPLVKDKTSQEVVQAVVYASRERVVGEVPRERILANELIRPERLANGNIGIGLNAVIPRGMRAMSVGLRGSDAVAGFLQPGNYVDVLVTMDDEFGRRRTETILQAVFVLGVNSRAQNEAGQEVEQRGPQSPSVTFLVTPGQAEDIAFADEVGDIALTLRNVQDVNYTQLPGAELDGLLARLKPRVPEAPPPVITITPRAVPVTERAAEPSVPESKITVIRGTTIRNERAQAD